MEDFDKSESIWKIDGPIGRLDYFWVVLAILFFLIPVLLLKIIGLATLLFPVCIILCLIGIYLTYVSYVKRIYDISGSLKVGVIVSILIFLLSFVLNWVGLIALLVCLFVPGKLLKQE